MPFPLNPADGQVAVVNNINYEYDATNGAWTRQSGFSYSSGNLTVTGNLITTNGIFWANGSLYGAGGSLYGNAEVAAYLPTSSVITGITANVTDANAAVQILSANIGTLISGAPGALDTLYEIANSLGNNSSLSTTLINSIANIQANVTGITYTKTLNFDGTVVVGVGTARWYPDTSITITGAYINASTPPVSGNLSLQLNKNGSPILSNVNLTTGTYRSNNYSINTTVSTTDYVTVDVINNGGAADATLTITYNRN